MGEDIIKVQISKNHQNMLQKLSSTLVVSKKRENILLGTRVILSALVFYRNFFRVLWDQFNGKVSSTGITYSGRVIRSSAHELLALALLRQYGFKLICVSKSHAVVKNSEGVIFTARLDHGMDFTALVESWVLKVYGRGPFIGKTVVDVGMYIGDSSIYFAYRGAKLVIGLEPFSESFKIAQDNITRNNLESVIIPLNAALGSKSGKQALQVKRDPNANSLVLQTEKAAEKVVDVHVLTVSQLMDLYFVNQIDLLKMDCEGCEYEVLNSLPDDTLLKIREIILEFHHGLSELPLRRLTQLGYALRVLDMHGLPTSSTTHTGILRARLLR